MWVAAASQLCCLLADGLADKVWDTLYRPGLCAVDCARSRNAVPRRDLVHRRKILPCSVQQLHQMERLQLASDAPLMLVELPRPKGLSHLSVGCSAAREMCLVPPRPWPANRELQPHAAGRNAAAKRVTASVSHQGSVTHKRWPHIFAQLARVLVNKHKGEQDAVLFRLWTQICHAGHTALQVVTSESPGSAPKAPAEHRTPR